MAFVPPNTMEMQPIFEEIGLTSDSAYTRQRSQEMRDNLVRRGNLFTLARPIKGGRSPVAHSFFHPQYTRAAFREAPSLDKPIADWLEAITLHLYDFATTPEARTIVSNGIVRHFNNIADVTVRFPDAGRTPWILASRNEEGAAVLGRLGITTDDMPVSSKLSRGDGSSRRRYYPVQKIAEHIGWTLPGIELKDAQQAIANGFAATLDPNRAADPYMLFKAGEVSMQGALYVPLRSVLGRVSVAPPPP